MLINIHIHSCTDDFTLHSLFPSVPTIVTCSFFLSPLLNYFSQLGLGQHPSEEWTLFSHISKTQFLISPTKKTLDLIIRSGKLLVRPLDFLSISGITLTSNLSRNPVTEKEKKKMEILFIWKVFHLRGGTHGVQRFDSSLQKLLLTQLRRLFFHLDKVQNTVRLANTSPLVFQCVTLSSQQCCFSLFLFYRYCVDFCSQVLATSFWPGHSSGHCVPHVWSFV